MTEHLKKPIFGGLARLSKPAAALAALALAASACGTDQVETSAEAGGASDTTAATQAAETTEATAEAQSDTVFDLNVANVADGSASSIRAAVQGDRPVLLWFYAPH